MLLFKNEQMLEYKHTRISSTTRENLYLTLTLIYPVLGKIWKCTLTTLHTLLMQPLAHTASTQNAVIKTVCVKYGFSLLLFWLITKEGREKMNTES